MISLSNLFIMFLDIYNVVITYLSVLLTFISF